MKTKIILKALLLFQANCIALPELSAQPSFSMSVIFRLYDKDGKIVKRADFCKEWTIGRNGRFFGCKDNDYVSFYDSLGYMYARLTSIYPPFVLSIAHKKDTMSIIFPTGKHLLIDSLTLENGVGLFSAECKEGDAVEFPYHHGARYCPLPAIDWQHLKELYANSKLEMIMRNGNVHFIEKEPTQKLAPTREPIQ